MAFQQLKPYELRLTLTLSAVVAGRMLGLFLVLPVFMLLAAERPGFTPAWAGLAIGVYGLTQALLQQPFGQWSDRWGRRRVMVVGLLFFVVGSVWAALADHMWGLIAGRAMQGCGAVAGVALAFVADHTGPQRRATAMAVIGMGIGAAFLLSIVVSAPLAAQIGLQGLFWCTAGLGLLGILLILGLPQAPGSVHRDQDSLTRAQVSGNHPQRADGLHTSTESASMGWLCASVFLLHALMTGLFVVLPGLLAERHGLALAAHWKIYAPALLLSAALVFPLLQQLSIRGLRRVSLPWAFAVLSVAFVLLSTQSGLAWVVTAVLLYFIAFNGLEAMMPALAAEHAGSAGRGRVMGRYTTFQFLGAFAGGVLSGLVLQLGSAEGLLLGAALLCIGWAWVARMTIANRSKPAN